MADGEAPAAKIGQEEPELREAGGAGLCRAAPGAPVQQQSLKRAREDEQEEEQSAGQLQIAVPVGLPQTSAAPLLENGENCPWDSPGACSASPRQEIDDEWEDASEAELESLILEDLDRYSREAIEKIMCFGYDRAQAQAAVWQHGSFAGESRGVLNNMVTNAMTHIEEEEANMRKRKSRDGSNGAASQSEEDEEWRQEELFESFVELQTDALTRAVNALLDVKPQLTRSDALWNLILADLDVNRACEMPTTSQEIRSAAAAARLNGRQFSEGDTSTKPESHQEASSEVPQSGKSSVMKWVSRPSRQDKEKENEPAPAKLNQVAPEPSENSPTSSKPTSENAKPERGKVPSFHSGPASAAHVHKHEQGKSTGSQPSHKHPPVPPAFAAQPPAVAPENWGGCMAPANPKIRLVPEGEGPTTPMPSAPPLQHPRKDHQNPPNASSRFLPGPGDEARTGGPGSSQALAANPAASARYSEPKGRPNAESARYPEAKGRPAADAESARHAGLSTLSLSQGATLQGESCVIGQTSSMPLPPLLDVNQWAAYCQELQRNLAEYQAQCQSLRHQVEERKEWAQAKVRQVVGKLQKDNAELKRLRAEVEASVRERAEHQACEAALEGRLNDSHETMRKAKADVDKMSARLKIVEKEIAVLRSELEASRLKEAETAAQAAEVAKRERKVVKKGAVWEKARTKLQEELTAEKQQSASLEKDLARTRERLQQMEVLWRQEEKAHEEAIEARDREKLLRDHAEKDLKRKEAAARQRSEQESTRHREEVQRLEAEIRRLKVAADHSTTLAAAACWGASSPGGAKNGYPSEGGSLSLQAALEMATLRESNGRLRQEVGLLQERVRRDRECVMCMSEEQSVVFLPCAHQVLCQQCNDVHRKNGMHDCPSCRTPIKQRIRVYGR